MKFLAWYTNGVLPDIIEADNWNKALEIALIRENPVYRLYMLNVNQKKL